MILQYRNTLAQSVSERSPAQRVRGVSAVRAQTLPGRTRDVCDGAKKRSDVKTTRFRPCARTFSSMNDRFGTGRRGPAGSQRARPTTICDRAVPLWGQHVARPAGNHDLGETASSALAAMPADPSRTAGRRRRRRYSSAEAAGPELKADAVKVTAPAACRNSYRAMPSASLTKHASRNASIRQRRTVSAGISIEGASGRRRHPIRAGARWLPRRKHSRTE